MRAHILTLAYLLLLLPFAAHSQQEAQALSDNLVLQSDIGPRTVTKSIATGRRVVVQSLDYRHTLTGTLYGVSDSVFVLRKTIRGERLRGMPVDAVKAVTLRRGAWQLTSKILLVANIVVFAVGLMLLLFLAAGLYYPGLAAAVMRILLAALVPLLVTTYFTRRRFRIPPWRIMR